MNTAQPIWFRKRPVMIQAIPLTKENVYSLARWCGGRVIEEAKPSDVRDVYIALEIPTLEGNRLAILGDYIIKGVEGEFYPCKPEIFNKTYERVNS